MPRNVLAIAATACLLAGACSREPAAPATTATPTTSEADAPQAGEVKANPLKDVYFGNFHVHTRYSFDGYTNGSVTKPDDAYRWAKGEAIPGGGGGGDLKIKKPLDWYAVSDHAEYLGVFPKMEDPNSPLSKLELAKRVTSKDQAVAFNAFAQILTDMSAGKSDPQLSDPQISRTIWKEVVDTADKHYVPGKFTTFPAFEWTSNPGKQNLHRVVVFERSANVPEQPFSALDSDKEESLWQWMDGLRTKGTTCWPSPTTATPATA